MFEKTKAGKISPGLRRQPAEQIFFDSNGNRFGLTSLLSQLHAYMLDQPERQYRLFVGTDSLAGRKQRAEFATALVIHRVGLGGRYFWQKSINGPIVTLRERMYQEAVLSIELARKLTADPLFQTWLGIGELVIHVDIGHNGPTRDMIQEIVGMITAHGFSVKIKPDAFAASKVADRHTIALPD